MKTLHISVTQEDIDSGRLRRPSPCPIALAIGRATAKPAVVGYANIGINGPHYIFATTPSDISRWIGRLDAGLPVEPCEFDIEVPA